MKPAKPSAGPIEKKLVFAIFSNPFHDMSFVGCKGFADFLYQDATTQKRHSINVLSLADSESPDSHRAIAQISSHQYRPSSQFPPNTVSQRLFYVVSNFIIWFTNIAISMPILYFVCRRADSSA
ncbi:hypothetical protein DD238_008018 [Peronospora effusa]|uniref:Uncharacterized protein n=1 Tax=Peronospora effusa TaxID=542832 RepID=A0A3M6V917_9STRA|nr:hypothetical protein DD238_008018 [Peronospora effusa]RQM13754.1 hypothetical protein DD237_007982 [Peronospora effusa]